MPTPRVFSSYASATTETGDVRAEITGNEVLLSWSDPLNGGTIEISRDGETIVREADAGYLSEVNANLTDYVVTWRRDLTDREVSQLSQSTADEGYVLDHIDGLEHFDSVLLDVGGYDLQPDAAHAVTLPTSTTFRYTTFIREDYIYAPDIACVAPSGSTYEYNGNNRGFSAIATSFKTRFGVTVDWTNAGNIGVTRSVQATKLYKYDPITQTRTLLSTKTASTDGMDISVISESATLASFQLTHDVKNPYCNGLAGGTYKMKVSVARSGNFSASGVVLKFPDHEFYVKDNDQTAWTAVLLNRASNAWCLTAGGSSLSGCLDNRSISDAR